MNVGDKVWIIKQGHSFYRKAGIIDNYKGNYFLPYLVSLVNDPGQYDGFKEYELKLYIPVEMPEYFKIIAK